MAKPTEKHPQIEEAITHLTGDNRKEAITENRCINPPIGCGGPAVKFRSEIGRREYSISGLCQKCQDEVFGRD